MKAILMIDCGYFDDHFHKLLNSQMLMVVPQQILLLWWSVLDLHCSWLWFVRLPESIPAGLLQVVDEMLWLVRKLDLNEEELHSVTFTLSWEARLKYEMVEWSVSSLSFSSRKFVCHHFIRLTDLIENRMYLLLSW